MFRNWRRVFAAVAFIAGCALTAHAQERRSAPAAVRLSLDSAYDAVRQAGASTGSATASRLRVEASQDRGSRRGRTRLWAGVTTDQSWGRGRARGVTTALSADTALTLTRRTQVAMSARATSSPLDLFPAFGAADAAPSTPSISSGSELEGTRTLAHSAQVAVTRTLGPRLRAGLTASHTASRSSADRVGSTAFGGRVSRRAGPFAEWYAGYRLTTTNYVRAREHGAQRQHDLDLGLSYARPLPFWDHTTFTVATGSTVLSDGTRRHMRLNTAAGVERRFARRWSGRADYTRPIQFVAGFAEPFLSDAVRLSLTGTLPGRTLVSASAGLARGTLGVAQGAAAFGSHTGSIRVARNIGPEWQVEMTYHDARYRFGSAASLGGTIPGRFARRGLRAGLVWAPAIGRGRR